MRLTAFGDVCVHIIVPCNGEERSREFQLGRVECTPGGSAVVLCMQVAALGHYARLVGPLGCDQFGQWVAQSLERLDVDCTYLYPGALVTSRLCIITRSNGTHSIIADLAPPVAEFQVRPEMLAEADFLYLPRFPAFDRLYQQLKEMRSSARMVCDFGYLPWLADERQLEENALPRLAGVDIAIFSGSTLSDKFNEHLAQRCIEAQVSLVVTTLSERGALMTTAEEQTYLPSTPTHVKNAVGAGDTLTAALLVALAEGRNAREAVRFAQVVASKKIARLFEPVTKADLLPEGEKYKKESADERY